MKHSHCAVLLNCLCLSSKLVFFLVMSLFCRLLWCRNRAQVRLPDSAHRGPHALVLPGRADGELCDGLT